MKKVRKTIVTVATTIVITLFVTESAAPARPSTFDAPPFSTASRTFSTMWYFVSRKPSRPRPFVRSCDVARARLDEAVHLVDERRHEQVAEPAITASAIR